MNPKRQALATEFKANSDKIDALLAGDNITPESYSQAEALQTRNEAIEAEVKLLKASDETRARAAAMAEWADAPDTSKRPVMPGSTETPEKREEEKPAHLQVIHRSAGSLSSFTGDREERMRKAYGFGMWLAATQLKPSAGLQQRALAYCNKTGIELRAQVEGINEQGGALVPTEFDNDMIILRESFGVFRGFAKVTQMTSDTKSVPRRTGGLTAYFEGEAAAITASTMGWDRVQLTAQKLAVLGRFSSELNEDAMIEIGNTLAGEISYAFSVKEDQCGFIGDGTSTYGGMTGITQKLLGLSGTIAYIAGLHVGAGNAYTELLLSDFNATKALLPKYALDRDPAWYCHTSFYANVMERLALAAGGVTAAEIAQGRRIPLFMGYPVRYTQAMPSIEGNSQVCALFGDLGLSTLFGDRRQTTIMTDNSIYFTSDEIAIRGTERFQINVHDVGNASATAGLRVPGPIVGLITAGS